MIRINQVKIKIGHTKEQLRKKAADILKIPVQDILEMEIVRQSIDARKKPDIIYSYILDVVVKKEEKLLSKLKQKKDIQAEQILPEKYVFKSSGEQKQKYRTVIVGTGPAGLFCGYYLALAGYQPILLERGKDVESRQRDVEAFWKNGRLNPNSNVQFGEGGAGTFSDGKLNTLVKDKSGRNKEVLRTFIQFGAKEAILYDAKPHIGTDVLSRVVKNMRQEIIRLGGSVRFESQVTDICIEQGKVVGVVINKQEKLPCEQIVLAIGHSARDTFSMLYQKNLNMEAKSFAVGLRVEHLQSIINKSQYGVCESEELGAAPYKVTAKTTTGRGVYSFCMCPGGYVVNASSEEGYLAVNGMSYSKRDGVNANSAVIVSVTPEDFGSESPLAGVEFQRKLEEKAYRLAEGKIPVQRYGVFKTCVEEKKTQEQLVQENVVVRQMVEKDCCMQIGFTDNDIRPQNKGNYAWADVSQILPEECNIAFVEGMESFGKQITGFNRFDVVLSGVESRTSSPVRIVRNEKMEASIEGIYPCGEGAGYAGGITSAAMDGIRVAEAIAEKFAPFYHRDGSNRLAL